MYRRVCSILCMMLVVVVITACSEKKEANVSKAVPLQVFMQEIVSSSSALTLKVDEEATLNVTVKNTGNEPWYNKGIDEKHTNLVALGFRWIDKEGNVFQEGRAHLANDLMPGASDSLPVKVQAPPESGDYQIRFSMVQEHVAWFYDKGAVPFVVSVKVKK
jgi:hypothetical protein